MKIFIISIFLWTFIYTCSIQSQWMQTNGPEGGSVSSFTSIGSNLFMSQEDNIYISTDQGTSWKPVYHNRQNHKIYDLLVLDSMIFARTKYGIMFSSDEGKNWEESNAGLEGLDISALSTDGSNLIIGTCGRGIYVSADHGSSWSGSTKGIESSLVYYIAASDTAIYSGTSTGVYISKDKGNNWVKIKNGIKVQQDMAPRHLALESNYLYVLYTYGTVSLLYRTNDNGNSWESIDIRPFVKDYNMVFTFNINGNDLFLGTSKGVFYTTDNGTNWRSVLNGQYTVNLFRNHNTVFAGTLYDGGVYRSTDNGNSWNEVNSGFNKTNIYSLAFQNETLIAGSYWDRIYVSKDNGTNWLLSNKGLQQTTIYSLASCDSFIFAGTRDGVYRSSDNGNSWIEMNNGLGSPYIGIGTCWVYFLAVNGKNIYAGTDNYGIYRSSDNGLTWTEMTNQLVASSQNVSITSITFYDNNIFASDGLFLYSSKDNGLTWSRNDYTEIPYGSAINCFSVLDNVLFIGTDTRGVFLSNDNGKNWTAVNSGLYNHTVKSLAISGQNIFAGTYDGVFLSTDHGANWYPVNENLNNKLVNILLTYGGNLFAGTKGDGVWVRPLSELTTSIQKNTENSSVKGYFLSQNYPNPFNPMTTVEYSISKPGNVRINVYDIRGCLIKELINDQKKTGKYSITWDGKDNKGNLVSSGVYFYSIQAGYFYTTNKMVLLK